MHCQNKQLKSLDEIPFEAIPLEVGILLLQDNYLSSPSDLSKLTKFQNLQELKLYGNQITSIPENFHLPNLKQLDLSLNKISNLTNELNLPNCQELNLNNN